MEIKDTDQPKKDNMQIGLTEFFTDPDINFSVSLKLNDEITKEINKILNSYSVENYLDYMFVLSIDCISTQKTSSYLNPKPHIDKKNKIITYYYFLPSIYYHNNSYERNRYVEYAVDGFEQLLNIYKIKLSLNKIKSKIIKKVVGNPKYDYTGHTTSKFSDEELFEILGRIPK